MPLRFIGGRSRAAAGGRSPLSGDKGLQGHRRHPGGCGRLSSQEAGKGLWAQRWMAQKPALGLTHGRDAATVPYIPGCWASHRLLILTGSLRQLPPTPDPDLPHWPLPSSLPTSAPRLCAAGLLTLVFRGPKADRTVPLLPPWPFLPHDPSSATSLSLGELSRSSYPAVKPQAPAWPSGTPVTWPPPDLHPWSDRTSTHRPTCPPSWPGTCGLLLGLPPVHPSAVAPSWQTQELPTPLPTFPPTASLRALST